MTLEVTPDAAEYVADKGYDVQYGARPLKRAIQRLLENPLSSALLRGEFEAGDTIRVTVDERGIAVADNGPGLPSSTIEGVLDFGVRVSSREAYVSPTRGAS